MKQKKLSKNIWKIGISPLLLETFVETGRFAGTCYRASNWQLVGQTKGRGRQDHDHTSQSPVKNVYLFPLQLNAREILSAGSHEPDKAKHAYPKDWAEEEFGAVHLGDIRLRERLLTIARDWDAKPQAGIPQACGTRAKTKAAYRFFVSTQ